jgi:tetratricopeptide (TPR) repeat protein
MTEQFSAMQFFNLNYILLVTFVLLFLWMFRDELKRFKWFKENSPSAVLVGSFLEQIRKLLKAHKFDQAKDYLVKSCEIITDNVELWCRLGFYNELLLKKQDEAIRCMKQAKSILESAKPSYKEIACYENYLGYILCNRGQTEEGLKHIEKSIELDPNPGRIKRYNEKLAEFNRQNKTIKD